MISYAINRTPCALLVALMIIVTGARADCVPPPPGLVSWWKAESNATDIVSSNNGALVNNATYGLAQVGQGFVFDGNGDGVNVGVPAKLQLQDLSIEGWIRRTSTTTVSFNGNGYGIIFSLGGAGGYGLYLRNDGLLEFGKLNFNNASAGGGVNDTNWHHVAVTKLSSNVTIYLDGVAYPAAPYDSGGFSFAQAGYVGAWRSPLAQADNSFYGAIDELAVYRRELSAAEIQGIYNAGTNGKCFGPAPLIIDQPGNQLAYETESVTFTVLAIGADPLSYQWTFHGTNLPGATASSLTLTNVQMTNGGNYGVVITNLYGTNISVDAQLAVTPRLCTPPAAGLIHWWRAEGDATDAIGSRHGELTNGVGQVAGLVGQAFSFDGINQAIRNSPPAVDTVSNSFTMEFWAWPQAGRAVTSEMASGVNGNGNQRYAIYPHHGDLPPATGIAGSGVSVGTNGISVFEHANAYLASLLVYNAPISGWTHIAVVYQNRQPNLYVNGVLVRTGLTSTRPSNPSTVVCEEPGSDSNYGYYCGLLDELSIYDRALSATEVASIYQAGAAGKCTPTNPPTITMDPTNRFAYLGATVTFAVAATGTSPLEYQWRFQGTNLPGRTGSSLVISNVQAVDAGDYLAVVTNVFGATTSALAVLTVTFPPAGLRVFSTNGMGGAPISVPVTIAANGNENVVGFSLNFDPQWLAFDSATVGSGTAGAILLLNTNQIGAGRVGLAVALPSGGTLAAGTQEVMRVFFNSAPVFGAASPTTTISFGDIPIFRELYDSQLQSLAANYASGVITLNPIIFEGDGFPRTNGNQAVTTIDWIQAARFVTRLDVPASPNEFQRIDCAPRALLGDGQLKVTDWVQAGRYVAGWDLLAAIGGPTNEITPTLAFPSTSRRLQVTSGTVAQGQTITLAINLKAQGSENAVGFTLEFDPAMFTFAGVTPGSATSGVDLLLNTNQTGSGLLGVALGHSIGSTFSAGIQELIKVSLVASGNAGVSTVALGDQLVARCVSNTGADEVVAGFDNGMVTVNSTNLPSPQLSIASSGTNVVLTWPLAAADFTLQGLDFINNGFGSWSNVPVALQTNGPTVSVTLPATNQTRLLRLFHP